MKFAAGITLYNPTQGQIEHIKQYEDCFEKVYIFDNSESSSTQVEYGFNDKFVLINEYENKGLPYAFNAIIAECDKKYDYLCTLDQDSVFTKFQIDKICRKIEELDGIEKIGIIGPFIDYGNDLYVQSEKVERKRWAITSGSFVNLNALRKENLRYDENYFIDRMDIDMSYALINKGYEVLMYYGSVLRQSLGDGDNDRHSNHSVLRHYYLFRNRFYFNNKWSKGIKKLFLNVIQTLRHACLIFIYEDNKFSKVKMLFKAYSDYKGRRLGKCEE